MDESYAQLIPWNGGIIGFNVCCKEQRSEQTDFWTTQAVQALIHNHPLQLFEHSFVITVFPSSCNYH